MHREYVFLEAILCICIGEMTYPDIDAANFLKDLLSRKEFYSLKSDPERNFRDPGVDPSPSADGDDVEGDAKFVRRFRLDAFEDPYIGKYLKTHSHQLFARNFMNPNTPYMRLYLMHLVGTGKTIAALMVARSFISVYKALYSHAAASLPPGRNSELDMSTPSVFVLGFGGTKAAFVRELMKHPEFGFVTMAEKEELVRRNKLADSGLPDDQKMAREYYSSLKKRITQKAKDGFFKFYGYDKFVNALFSSDDLKLTDLEFEAKNRNVPLEDVFRDYIKSGKLKINQRLLKACENSLLICDEIHNTYNMNTKNNRGIAIQYLLDNIPSMRFLALSATPINNSPTEVVELINYLVEPDKKVTKRELFANNRDLRPGMLERIGELIKGKVSFLRDTNVKYFPRSEQIGEELILPLKGGNFSSGTALPYLKFVQCEMPKLHRDTCVALLNGEFVKHVEENGSDDEEEETHSIPTDGYTIYDMVFPNPASDDIGLFRSSETKKALVGSTQEWRDKVGIVIKKTNRSFTYPGPWLRRDRIAKYAAKLPKLLDLVMNIIKSAKGNPDQVQKIMIYHDRVYASGVVLIQELLKENNIIDEFAEPTANTLCTLCGRPMTQHDAIDPPHVYVPVRFVIVHSDVDPAAMDQALAKFNAPENAHGQRYQILVGSKIIKEAYDFKDNQHLILTSLPTNIPTLLQVFGRCIRKNSHANLEVEQRVVRTYILVSVFKDREQHLAPEVHRYAEKLSDYVVIQQIEREFTRNAIDAVIHRDIVMPPEVIEKYFPDGTKEPKKFLGNLYFDAPELGAVEVKLDTFAAYGYKTEEIKIITYIIKRLFMLHSVWTYDDLWSAVREPPIGIEVNPKLFEESSFIIALNNLAKSVQPITSVRGDVTSHLERIFDHNDRYVYKGGVRCKVEQIDKYYIAFPVTSPILDPINQNNDLRYDHIRDKDWQAVAKTAVRGDHPIIDAETYARPIHRPGPVMIDVANYIATVQAAGVYKSARANIIEFVEKHDVQDFLFEFPINIQIRFVKEIIEASGVIPKGTAAKVLEVLGAFGVILQASEVILYKDVAKRFPAGYLQALSKTKPVGLCIAKSVLLYDGGAWIEASKIALNKQVRYRENNVVIGYIDGDDDVKFKLRSPLHKIKASADARVLERGAVCVTRGKAELAAIVAELSNKVARDGKVYSMCETIRKQLCEKEKHERAKDSRVKYLYGWWDELPNIAGHVSQKN